MAEPTFAEAKAAVDALNTAFNEFKQTNDQRIAQIESKGVADPLIQQKLDTLNAEIAKHSAVVDAFADLEAKVNRLALAGAPVATGDEAKELAAFNMEVRASALEQGRPAQSVSGEEYRAYKQGLDTYLRRGEKHFSADEQRGMQVGIEPDGGYLVSADMSGRIVVRRFESSPIRQIAAVRTIGTDRLEGLRDIDEVSGGGWVGEVAPRPQTNAPQIGKYEIPVHEQYENPAATQKLLDDASIDVAQWLADKVADRLARREATAFVSGNGVSKPRGFGSYSTAATADTSRAWGVLEHVATGSSGSFGTSPNGSDKLIDLVHRLKAHYRQGARWVMSRVTLGAARKLKDENGNYIWLPTMMAGQPSQLLGYPTTEAEDMPAIGADSLSIAFGNFTLGYQIVDRIGIRTLRDPFTNKPYIHFYTTARVGGDVIDFEAIKFLKFGS